MFYEDCREGLGHEFLVSVEATFDAIAHRPTLWRRLKGRFRRCLVHRFPYGSCTQSRTMSCTLPR